MIPCNMALRLFFPGESMATTSWTFSQYCCQSRPRNFVSAKIASSNDWETLTGSNFFPEDDGTEEAASTRNSRPKVRSLACCSWKPTIFTAGPVTQDGKDFCFGDGWPDITMFAVCIVIFGLGAGLGFSNMPLMLKVFFCFGGGGGGGSGLTLLGRHSEELAAAIFRGTASDRLISEALRFDMDCSTEISTCSAWTATLSVLIAIFSDFREIFSDFREIFSDLTATSSDFTESRAGQSNSSSSSSCISCLGVLFIFFMGSKFSGTFFSFSV
mmetsp:Transcript_5155/g.11168  ORF Transcript_5155/g.11168 Transcript_5155/m.11168 type:complete len:271 (-) Transcript_5155:1443-2255(-)